MPPAISTPPMAYRPIVPPRAGLKTIVIAAILASTVIFIFSPLFSAEFLQWDDGFNLFENPRMLPPTWSSCAYYWSHQSVGLYVPVTYTVWSGLAAISQKPGDEPGSRTLDPAPFHTANVLFHALAVMVVFALLRTWTGDLPAGAGALLFAIHPMQVEAVGWACGTKDVLAGLFGLTAVWQYLRHLAQPSKKISWHYFAALAAFVAATLSKPSAIVIPILCFIIAIGICHAPWRKVGREVLPWLCISAVIFFIANASQEQRYTSMHVPLWFRPLVATDALAFYLGKLVWPVNLCLDYGRSPLAIVRPPDYPAYWTWIIPVTIGSILWWRRRAWPRIFTAALVSLVAIFPVLGLAGFTFQAESTVADHYVYVAMLGPAIAMAAILRASRNFLTIITAAAAFTVLAVLCHWQTFNWLSEPLAFGHVVDVDPRSVRGHAHLWRLQLIHGNIAAAQREVATIIAVAPKNGEGYTDLADTLDETGHWQDAIAEYQLAIKIAPDYATAYNNLASLYARHGDFPRAIALYRKSLAIDPEYNESLIGLANAMKAQTK